MLSAWGSEGCSQGRAHASMMVKCSPDNEMEQAVEVVELVKTQDAVDSVELAPTESGDATDEA